MPWDRPADTVEHRPDAASMVIPVTPWSACAVAALVVSVAALLFTLGRLVLVKIKFGPLGIGPGSAGTSWATAGGKLQTIAD